MKITNDHFEILKNKVKKVLSNELINSYEFGDFPNSDRVKNLQKRFCFDILLYIGRCDRAFVDELYKYLNDDDIYTAINKIVPKLQQRYDPKTVLQNCVYRFVKN